MIQAGRSVFGSMQENDMTISQDPSRANRMTQRQRIRAVLRYEEYDRLPIVHFGYWPRTFSKWAAEGHVSQAEPTITQDAYERLNPIAVRSVSERLGFDCAWAETLYVKTALSTHFERKVLEELPDGYQKVLDHWGTVVIEKPGTTSIPASVDHLLKGRKEWEEIFLPMLEFSAERVDAIEVNTDAGSVRFDQGGREYLQGDQRTNHYGVFCGSLYGSIRNWLGLEGLCYLLVDDEPLLDEMIETVSELSYQCLDRVLKTGVQFDLAHFWEDICFKNGPLVAPKVFAEKVGPHYKRLTDLLAAHGIDVVSLDCDGKIDALIPIWLDNGVNTMFPMEVGTWNASIKPWRKQYGRQLRGVGGMDKRVFAQDRAAVDAEIERLKPLVALGGYVPCPDHLIALDAEWDNIRYYCDRMRETFS